MLTSADRAYIRANFIELEEFCTRRGIPRSHVGELIEQRMLPRPSYILDDGTEMVPADYFVLYDAAGGQDVEQLFRNRFTAKALELGFDCSNLDLGAEWEGYLSGDFGVCLHEQTPENICAKGFHMTTIEQLLEAPRPQDQAWLDMLARHVTALDRLERPFAPYDRVRWGAVSRDRLISSVRERYPRAFAQSRPHVA